MRRNLPPDVAEKAAKLRAEGHSDSEIGRRLGVHHSSVSNWLGPREVSSLSVRVATAKQLRKDGMNNTQIAEHMGVAYNTVFAWIGSQPKSYRWNAIPEEVYTEAVPLRVEEHLSNEEIAERVGVHYSTIYRWMGSAPAHARRNRDYSHTRYHSRAMYLRECGMSITEISAEMRVPRSTIGQWLCGYGCYGLPTER